MKLEMEPYIRKCNSENWICKVQFLFIQRNKPPNKPGVELTGGVLVFVLQLLGLTLSDPSNSSPPGSSGCEISQARILEWVSISFSRGSSWSRDQTCISCIAGDPPGKPQHILPSSKRPHGSEEWILWCLRKSRMAGHSSPSSNGWPRIFSPIYHFKPHHNTVRE